MHSRIHTLPSVVEVQWPTSGWIKANVNQTGFYRVNYEEENWRRIIQHLKDNPQSNKVHSLACACNYVCVTAVFVRME